MSRENRQVNRAQCSGVRERYRPNIGVIDEVEREERARGRKRRNHHALVDLLPAPPDERVPPDQQHCRSRIQHRVDRRKVAN